MKVFPAAREAPRREKLHSEAASDGRFRAIVSGNPSEEESSSAGWILVIVIWYSSFPRFKRKLGSPQAGDSSALCNS